MSAAGPITEGACAAPHPPPPAAKRGRRLRTIGNVREGLAAIWRQVEAGSIDLARARVLVYCGSVMLAALEKGDLEDRIEALEAAARKESNG